jgi:hypothetical protein
VAYQETTGANDVKCIVFSGTGSYTSTVGSAAADAAPVPASEWSGTPPEVGVVYHDQSGNAVLAISNDYGSSWYTSFTVGLGSYPFIDIPPGHTRTCVGFVNQAGTGIMTGNAAGISSIATAGFSLRTDQTPSDAGPPVVRYSPMSTDAEIYGLFYLGAGPRDFWYDNSILTGVSGSEVAETSSTTLGLEPNPFHGSTSIRVRLDTPGHVELTVYSLDGRIVEQVYSGVTDGGLFPAGESLPSGVYTVVMGTGSGTETIRMVKL